MLPFYEQLEHFLKDLRSNSGFRLKSWPIFALGLLLLLNALIFMQGVAALAFSLALFLAPLWLPFLLMNAAWSLWVNLKRSEFIAKQDYIVLEVKPPRSFDKTPLAMEAVLSGLHHHPGEGTWYKKYFLGGVRPWWSLELASLEGQVHLFIWTRAAFRRLIESNIYSQYPGAQVVEVPDYTRLISAKESEWGIWGCDFTHTDKDPIPIKTYVEYGLDKVQKEHEQVDPLANLIEFMGSMGSGEYLWVQFIIREHRGEKYGSRTNASGKQYTWRDEAAEIVSEIRTKTRETYTDPVTGQERPGFPNPTKGQSDKIAAIERNTSKLAFDVGARAVYLCRPDRFDPIVVTGIIGLFKQFSSEGWNGIKGTRWMMEFDDYPWELGSSKLKRKYRRELVEAYRRRQFFHEPFKEDPMVMSTEELATVYHLPSGAVPAPALPRIQSATSEAPSNLPV